MVTMGYRYIYCCLTHPKAWLQWLQLVTRVTGTFSVLGYILKLGCSGYSWL